MMESEDTSAGMDSLTVLFVSPGPDIATPKSGEGTRLHHLSNGIAQNASVVGVLPSGTERPDWMAAVYYYDQWSLPTLTDLNPSFIRAVWQAFRDHEIDVVHQSKGLLTTRPLATVLRPSPALVYAAQNFEVDHARDFVSDDLPVHKRALGPRLIPLLERSYVSLADGVTTVSEADRESFIEYYGIGDDRVEAVPTGTQAIDRETLRPPQAIRDELGLDDGPVAVFHGTYSHPPNREAVDLIVEEIAPTMRRRGVDVQFLLVGNGIPEVDGSNVHVAGFVDDLFSVLNAADFAVVPIRHGGGTKTKMYDYISLGLPIVTTEKGAEGIDLEDDVHAVLTADVDEPFVEAVTDLAQNEGNRGRLEEHLESLSTTLTWDNSVKRLSAFYRQLLSQRV